MPVTHIRSSQVADDDLKTAYEEGRRDERAKRKRHPVLMTILFLLALAGAILLVLALVNGSFRDAGAMADSNLAVAADRAAPVIEDAAARTGDAARGAARDAAASLRGADQPAPPPPATATAPSASTTAPAPAATQ
jgi:hypothetical protein